MKSTLAIVKICSLVWLICFGNLLTPDDSNTSHSSGSDDRLDFFQHLSFSTGVFVFRLVERALQKLNFNVSDVAFESKTSVRSGLILLKNSVFGSDQRNSSPYRAASFWWRGVRPNWLSAAHMLALSASRPISSDFFV